MGLSLAGQSRSLVRQANGGRKMWVNRKVLGQAPIPLNEALLSEVELAVRGSPDPARRLTEGLPGQRLALIPGDLRSNPRRGRETRAEREKCG